MISLKVIGAKTVINCFRKAASDSKSEVLKLFLEASALIERSAKKKVSGPVLNARTGRLRRSIHTRAQGSGFDTVVTVGPSVHYAAIHEFGGKTPPHTIFPKRKPQLSFMVGGQLIHRKRVNHPGSRILARPYMRPSLEENREEIERLVGRAFKSILK
jgi:phage gpG-like protein